MDRLSMSQTFEAVLDLERQGLTRTAAFRRLATDLGVSSSAVQSRFYDEAQRRGGIPRPGRHADPDPATIPVPGLHLVFQQYLTRLNSKRVTAEHLAKTERALGRFHRHLLDDGVDPLAVPYHIAQGYFDGPVRELSLQTVNEAPHLTAVSAAYRFAQDLGTAVGNPTKLVVLPEQADEAPATYTNEELRRMLDSVETEQEELCLQIFIWTGMRRFEALGVRLDAIDWEANCIPVLGKGRPRKLRLVPIHPTFRQVLLRAAARTREGQVYLIESNRRRAMGRDRLTEILTAVAARAGVELEGHEGVSKDGLQCAVRGGRSGELHRGDPRTRAAHRQRAPLPARARPQTAGNDPHALPIRSAGEPGRATTDRHARRRNVGIDCDQP